MNALIKALGEKAKSASAIMKSAKTAQKNHALRFLIEEIKAQESAILSANQKDLAKSEGLNTALKDRLALDQKRLEGICQSLEEIIKLPDPIGEIRAMKRNEKGLEIGRMRVPLGVIGIIYESRPNVTIDAAALIIKSGNCAILRGGSEALYSNKILWQCVQKALDKAGLDKNAVQFIEDCDRAHVDALLQAEEYIDVLIPRGGKNLVRLISEKARIPVIKHLDGICHLYVDKSADIALALRIADNGKSYRYGICGATETLLIHQEIASAFLPEIEKIFSEKNIEIRACARALPLLKSATLATEEDWRSEYLAPIISIKIVDDYQSAVYHINHYGSHHTDSIACQDLNTAQNFLRDIDSASVMINTPTCFADGYEYGLGAEIGISTNKLHWRGPVGLEGLSCEKFIILSEGITR